MNDVIIVGGSFAGLSAALQLGRARRTVTVLDTNTHRNRYAAHAHGILGHDGKPPRQILNEARAQLAHYPTVHILESGADAIAGEFDHFTVSIEGGETLHSRRVLLSHGIIDQFPDLPGFAESWGISVLHCPYCHGFEVADGRLGILYSNPVGLHMGTLLADWSDRLTLFADGHTLPDDELAKLAAQGVSVVLPKITRLDQLAGQISAVVLETGERVPLDAMFAHPRQKISAKFHEQLDLALTEGPLGSVIKVDDMFETSRKGIFAAGDVASLMQSANLAMGNGAMAGVMCHRSLLF